MLFVLIRVLKELLLYYNEINTDRDELKKTYRRFSIQQLIGNWTNVHEI
jgi:hypothetical protein